MDFPANPPVQIPPPTGLAEALGATPLEVWAGAFLVALLESEEVVRGLRPDVDQLKSIGGQAANGPGNIAVAALADADRPYDVVSRFFAPGSGISEDPATGSLTCMLSPLFAMKLGRADMRFHQAYPGRGGDIGARLSGSRVVLDGHAVTVAESRLRI
jgi:predicted PhzF superfamily epimerase YddE/YHI9